MNSKQFLSGVCALVLMAGLSGCGKAGNPPAGTGSGTTPAGTEAAAEAPVSQDTLLAMELVNNYLAMEKPQHESFQIRFGLLTSELNRPICRFEDWSYTQSGEAAMVYFGDGVISMDTYRYRDELFNGQVQDSFLDHYLYPEETQWRDSLPYGHYDDWLDGVCFYYKNPTGEETLRQGPGGQGFRPATGLLPAHYGFASLPRKSHSGFLREAAEDSSKAQQTFTLSEDKIYDMAKKQALFREYEEESSKNSLSKETTLSYYHYMTMEKRPCYAVSYDIPAEYVSAFNGRLMDELFNQVEAVMTTDASGVRYMVPVNLDEVPAYPVKMRLSSGPVHVSLYFDKDTRQCIGQRLDLTDCSKELMDHLCTLNHVKAGDRTFIIDTQYFDNSFQKLPDFLEHQPPEEQKANQAVFYVGEDQCVPEMSEIPADFVPGGDPFTLNRYESSFDESIYLHRITENGELIGLMEIFDKNASLDIPEDPYDPTPAPEDFIHLQGEEIKDYLLKEMGIDPQECRTPNGIPYTFCKELIIIPSMDWDPDTVCMGISRDKKTGTLCMLYSDDQNKIESILEDLSWQDASASPELSVVPEMSEETIPAPEPHHQILSLEHYGLALNRKTGLYEITDETGVIGTLQKYSYTPELDPLIPEARTSGKGLTYLLYEVPMGTLFGKQDCNPEETGFMASFREKGTTNDFLLSVWERETAEKIMEDLSMTTEVMPNFWEIQGPEPNLMMP